MKTINYLLVLNEERLLCLSANNVDSEPDRVELDRSQCLDLRAELDELLGDRKPEPGTFTSESLAALCMALKDNPAAAEHLGLPLGGDVLRQIAEWAKSYRAPTKTVDFVGERYATPEPPSCLSLQERAEIRFLAEHALAAPEEGDYLPQEVEAVARRVLAAMDRLIDEPPAGLKETLGAALRSYRCRHSVYHDGEGKALAVLLSGGDKSVATGEEEIDLLANRLAEAVSRVRAISPEEAKAVRLCAREAHAKAAGLVAPERRRVLHAATLVFRVLDRLSGAAGQT